MKTKNFNKLVRDRIPEIIEQSNRKVFMKILDDDEFINELVIKRNEEFLELEEAIKLKKIPQIIEEMADLLLVEETIGKTNKKETDPKICSLISQLKRKYNISHAKLKRVYDIKNKEKGRFNRKIFLIKTESND